MYFAKGKVHDMLLITFINQDTYKCQQKRDAVEIADIDMYIYVSENIKVAWAERSKALV